MGGSFLGGIHHEGKRISMKGAGFSSIIKKKNEKENKIN